MRRGQALRRRYGHAGETTKPGYKFGHHKGYNFFTYRGPDGGFGSSAPGRKLSPTFATRLQARKAAIAAIEDVLAKETPAQEQARHVLMARGGGLWE